MKKRQKILELNPLLSKTLDSFCLDLALTSPDPASIGLIQICQWRLKQQISRQQFSQLYKQWVQAKGINDPFKIKQTNTFDKAELISIQYFPQDFTDILQLSRVLEMINQEYNLEFLETFQRPDQLEAMEKIFSYLDPEGIIHLRLSSLFFLFQALLNNRVINIKDRSIKTFLDSFQLFQNQLYCIKGKLSLRNFKNYMFHRCNIEVLNKIVRFFKEVEKFNNTEECLPDIFVDSLTKWKTYPRFSSNNRKKLDYYKRVFQEHDHLFYDLYAQPNQIEKHLTVTYGKSCLVLYDIDHLVIKEFCEIFKENIEKQIKIFLSGYKTEAERSKPSLSNNPSTKQNRVPQKSKSRSVSARKPNHSISTNKSILQKRNLNNISMHTPTKLSMTLGPSTTPSKFQLTDGKNLHTQLKSVRNIQQQANNTINKRKSGLNNNITTRISNQNEEYNSKTEFLQKMSYFKNKKVQPFDVVMKRLRKK